MFVPDKTTQTGVKSTRFSQGQLSEWYVKEVERQFLPDVDGSDSTDELMPAQKLVRRDEERSILLRGGN